MLGNSEVRATASPPLRVPVTQEKLQQLKEGVVKHPGWGIQPGRVLPPGRKEDGCQRSGRNPGEQVGLARTPLQSQESSLQCHCCPNS